MCQLSCGRNVLVVLEGITELRCLPNGNWDQDIGRLQCGKCYSIEANFHVGHVFRVSETLNIIVTKKYATRRFRCMLHANKTFELDFKFHGWPATLKMLI